ncbi:AAA family ATPase [Jatrophihabitans sp. YIM 134969]
MTGYDIADLPTASSFPDDWYPASAKTTSTTTTKVRKVEVTWADSITPEAVVWAWIDSGEGRVPSGTLTILAGREGTGKSSCALWLGANITRGSLPGSLKGKPKTVLIAATEDSWRHTLVPRLMAAGADLGRVGRIDVTTTEGDEVTLSLPHDLAALKATIKTHDVGLVILDPLLSMIGDGIDTHRSHEVRSALDPLAKLADETGAIVCGIAHFNKSAGTDAASLITGSGAFKDVPRSVFGFARDDDGRVMTQVKNSLGRDDLPSLSYTIETVPLEVKGGTTEVGKFVFTGTSERSVSDVLRDAASTEDQADRTEVVDWITKHLTDLGGEAVAGDVLKASRRDGFSDRTVQRARKKVATAERRGFGAEGRWVWVLIDDTKGAIDVTPQKVAPMASMAAPMEAERPAATVVSLFGTTTSTDCDHPDKVKTTAGKCALCIAANLTNASEVTS